MLCTRGDPSRRRSKPGPLHAWVGIPGRPVPVGRGDQRPPAPFNSPIGAREGAS